MASLPRSCLRRTACDRCRSLKLRCLWADQEGPQQNTRCLRCARLELQCDVAPPRRAGRPRKSTAAAGVGQGASNTSTTTRSSSAGSTQGDAVTTNTPANAPPDEIDLNMLQGDHPFLPEQNLETGGLDFQHFDYLPEHRSQPYHIPMADAGPVMMNMPQQHHLHPHSQPQMPPGISSDASPANLSATTGNQHHHQQLLTTGSVSLINLPFSMELQPPPPPKLDQTQCLRELSELNMEVHHQCSLVLAEMQQSPDGHASFQSFLEIPVDGITRCEHYLMLGQRFVTALSNLEWVLLDEWKDRLLSSRFQDTGTVDTSDEDDDGVIPQQHETNRSSPWPNCDLPPKNDQAGQNHDASEPRSRQQPFMAPETQTPWGFPLSPSSSSATSSPIPYQSHLYQPRDQHRPRPHPYDTLATAPALLLASIYSQMITLFEAFISGLGRRLINVDQEPIAPITVAGKGCGMGAFYAVDPRLEGLFFVDATRTLLDGMERRLGVLDGQERRARNLGYSTEGTMGLGRGLFTGKKRYKDILVRELGRGDGMPRGGRVEVRDHEEDDDAIEQANGTARPKRLRERMERVRTMMTNDPFW